MAISISLSANVLDDLIVQKKPLINEFIIELLKRGLSDEVINDDRELANLICKKGGLSEYECTRYDGPKTVAQSICAISEKSIYECTRYDGPKTIAQSICVAGGKSIYECTRYDGPKTIAQSICVAGGKSIYECTRYDGPKTVAQSICIAGGKSIYKCTRYDGPKTIAEAIDGIPYNDRTYWWDRFKDQYGKYQWRCRGGQTKQFADSSKCSGINKDDDRWPG